MSFAAPVKMPTKNAEMAQYGDDSGLWVVFERRPVYQEFASKEAGREIWKDEDYVIITNPGAKTDFIERVRLEDDGPSRPAHPNRFPRQWAQFQASHEQAQTGIPLEQWAGISKSRVLEMKAQRIHTVEQLAAIPDSILQTLGMGARSLQTQARAYLDSATKNAEFAKIEAQNSDMRAEMEAMRAQLRQLSAQQNGIAGDADNFDNPELPPTKRGPGRPRKEQNDDV